MQTLAKQKKNAGFTLIEVLITILFFGLLAAIPLPYILESTIPTAQSAQRVKNSFLLNAIMDSIIADYNAYDNPRDAVKALYKASLDDGRYGKNIIKNQSIPYTITKQLVKYFPKKNQLISEENLTDCDGLQITLATKAAPHESLTYFFGVR